MPFSFEEKFDSEIRVSLITSKYTDNIKVSARYYFFQYGAHIVRPLDDVHNTFKDVNYQGILDNNLFSIIIKDLVNSVIDKELLNIVTIKIKTNDNLDELINNFSNRNMRTKYNKVDIEVRHD